MKIAIHHREGSFSEKWTDYCARNHIPYKIVNCYQSDIIHQLEDCDALMWHFHHANPKDILFAKELLYSIQASGKKVFPNFNTVWHFDDKLGQKYLLESIGAPLVPSWVFYKKQEALKWIEEIEFPIVFKLRGGAGSQNVRLIHSFREGKRLICKAFSRGFLSYYALGSLRERWRKYQLGKSNFRELIEGIVRFLMPPTYAFIKGRERGYIYFQKYIPNCDYDIRIVVIKDKAYAIKRMVRKGDFRASGSGEIRYDRSLFNEETIKLSFQLAEKLNSQCLAIDYIYANGRPLLTEISYGTTHKYYDPCPGYYDNNYNWHEGRFDPYGWMVENLILDVQKEY